MLSIHDRKRFCTPCIGPMHACIKTCIEFARNIRALRKYMHPFMCQRINACIKPGNDIHYVDKMSSLLETYVCLNVPIGSSKDS